MSPATAPAQPKASRSFDSSGVVALVSAALGVGGAAGGAAGASLGAGKIEASLVKVESKLERIEASLADLRDEQREQRRLVDELRLWRAQVEARTQR